MHLAWEFPENNHDHDSDGSYSVADSVPGKHLWHLAYSSPHQGGGLVEQSFCAEAAAVATSVLPGRQLGALLSGPRAPAPVPFAS